MKPTKTETLATFPQGRFELRRFPCQAHDPFRAWDAADEYLLHELAEKTPDTSAQLTLLNDAFGALAVALSSYHPVSISDSWLSQQATLQNLRNNTIAPEQLTLLSSLEKPEQAIDVLLIKIPKTLALLEYQLLELRPLLKPSTCIIAAGMVKNLPKTVFNLFQRVIGPTTTSLARKKARLIYVTPDLAKRTPENPYPSQYVLENSDLVLRNHANVFSRERLDIGARFMLQHLPTNERYRQVIDLGCGNGVLGLMFARQNPDAHIQFVDESFMALDSARMNFEQAFGARRRADFIATDCLSGVAENSADLILCNPPFHQQHAVGDYIARRMFRQAKKVLVPGADLIIIGNRHLGYHVVLKHLFGDCTTLAANRKFVILKVRR